MQWFTVLASLVPGLGRSLPGVSETASVHFRRLWLHACLLGMGYQAMGQVEWSVALLGAPGFSQGGSAPTVVVTTILCLLHSLSAWDVLHPAPKRVVTGTRAYTRKGANAQHQQVGLMLPLQAPGERRCAHHVKGQGPFKKA